MHLSDEDRLLLARVGDMRRIADERGLAQFSPFLDGHGQRLVSDFMKNAPCGVLFGGAPGCERKMLGIFPDEADLGQFPITPVTVSHRAQKKLSHRDFLGALMNLKITRGSIGDIFTPEGMGVIFLASAVAPIVVDELSKVGSEGVRCILGMPGVPLEQQREEHGDFVSSMRLDCVLAAMINLSRAQSASLIESGRVSVNHVEALSPSQNLREGDRVSVKGYGRYEIGAVAGLSKKGRLRLNYNKFI